MKKYIIQFLLLVIISDNALFANTSTGLAWTQNSVEKKAISHSMYQLARMRLDYILEHKNSSAFVNQTENHETLPPAVIMDIDDTILDTSAYAGYLEKNNLTYTAPTWYEFTSKADSPAISGAIDFINYAQSKGVTIFFVTNRDANEKNATIKNLNKIGVKTKNLKDYVLTKGEKPEWRSNKHTRYDEIAKTHRITMIIGDDFNDFIPIKGLSLKEYSSLFEKHKSHLGFDWIQIPNPLYGNWEGIDGIKTSIRSFK
jgi:5'-nucleotidase (lipoprotein e(P4) family)